MGKPNKHPVLGGLIFGIGIVEVANPNAGYRIVLKHLYGLL